MPHQGTTDFSQGLWIVENYWRAKGLTVEDTQFSPAWTDGWKGVMQQIVKDLMQFTFPERMARVDDLTFQS